jgi:hypothetical protein
VSINIGLAHDHCSTWVLGFKSYCICFCMPLFLHCDRVSPKTQSIRDDAIDGWCGEMEDPASVCLSATTTSTWHWNILGQVRLILKPRFCHLGGCRTDLVETVNMSEWTGSDRQTNRPSELIYKILCVLYCDNYKPIVKHCSNHIMNKIYNFILNHTLYQTHLKSHALG